MFEKEFGRHLKEMLANEMKVRLKKDYVEIALSTNNQYRPLENDREAISVVIKTGSASKSHVPGYDLNTLPLTVSFIIWEPHLNALLEALTAISDRDNATFGELIIDDCTTKYKVVFNTPYVAGSPQSLRSANGSLNGNMPATIKAVSVVWFLNITYSNNAIIEPPQFKLRVGFTDYEMDYIISYSTAVNPVYDGNLVSGLKYIRQDVLSISKTYVFTLCRTESGVSALQDLLMKEFEDEEQVVKSPLLYLVQVSNGKTKVIDISSILINYGFDSNGAVIMLTLGR